jgi:quercetin dioxygenase-like cupin family protein
LDLVVATEVKFLYIKRTNFLQLEFAMNETITPAAPDVIRVGSLEISYRNEAANGCKMGCFELRVPPGSNVPPPHSHIASEEIVYVLEGTLRYTVGSETRDLQPGQSMATPCGVVHGFSNPHAAVARALVINSPDIGAQYFREVALIVNAGGPPDRVKLTATMQKFGLVPGKPPEGK